jgi:hypothetical protein
MECIFPIYNYIRLDYVRKTSMIKTLLAYKIVFSSHITYNLNIFFMRPTILYCGPFYLTFDKWNFEPYFIDAVKLGYNELDGTSKIRLL